MGDIEFRVDRHLKLLDCNTAFRKALNFSGRLGAFRYFELFPRIFSNERDAVESVLESGEPLSLSDYRFGCLESCVRGNITITPINRGTQPSKGARVTVKIIKECEIAERLKESEHLIDIGKTASSLAHGFRNPLNAIKGAVVFLKEKYSQEKILQDFSEIIEEEITRLDDFITDFLRNDFQDSTPPDCNVNQLLTKIERVTAMQAEARQVRVNYHYGSIPDVQINPRDLEQAILNILNNSLDALPQGGEITVESCAEEIDGNRFVQVSISDNGPGIRENSLAAFAAPPEGRARSTGKGFGLFLAREAMKRYNGEFQIQTRSGQGTTVLFRLPGHGPVRGWDSAGYKTKVGNQ